jgi:hypothetical protein
VLKKALRDHHSVEQSRAKPHGSAAGLVAHSIRAAPNGTGGDYVPVLPRIPRGQHLAPANLRRSQSGFERSTFWNRAPV